jgi:hypothetical protein
MRTILHIQSDTTDARAEAVIDLQCRQPDLHVERFDLRVAHPDYAALLDRIFAADSVAVW